MTEEFVTVKGYKFYVKDDLLDLHNKGIKDITEIEGLEKPTNLKALYLSRNQIEEINGLEQLTKLQILDLSGNKIKVIKGLEKLTGLKELYLNHNQLEEIKGLETLTNLEKLRLDENPIREDEVPILDICWKNIQYVVRYCRKKKEGKVTKVFVTVEEKKYYVHDDTLNLRESGISDISEIKGLETLVNLKVLNLSKNYIQEIKGLENLKNLQVLNLSNNNIKEIKGLEALTNLLVLVLTRNRITRIKGLEHLINLHEIHIWDREFLEKGVREDYIVNFYDNPLTETDWHLTWRPAEEIVRYCQEMVGMTFVTVKGNTYYAKNATLDLRGKGITDIEEIEGLEQFKHLFSLNLSDNMIKEINGLGHLSSLIVLSLDGNQIQEIKGLERLTNLQTLDLNNNPIRENERYLVERRAQELVRYCQEKIGRKVDFVTIRGKKYYVIDRTLDLSALGITDIKEIEELEKLENLKALDLTKNKIKEIKGLEHLFYLEELYLYGNPLPEDELDLMYLEAQEVVKYCQEKVEKQRT